MTTLPQPKPPHPRESQTSSSPPRRPEQSTPEASIPSRDGSNASGTEGLPSQPKMTQEQALQTINKDVKPRLQTISPFPQAKSAMRKSAFDDPPLTRLQLTMSQEDNAAFDYIMNRLGQTKRLSGGVYMIRWLATLLQHKMIDVTELTRQLRSLETTRKSNDTNQPGPGSREGLDHRS